MGLDDLWPWPDMQLCMGCRVASCGSIDVPSGRWLCWTWFILISPPDFKRISIKTLYKSKQRGSYEIILSVCCCCRCCVCVSGQAAEGLGSPRAPVTHGEFLIPGSHSWLLPGWQMGGKWMSFSLCVCFCGPSLTWHVLKPCRMSPQYLNSTFNLADPSKTFPACVFLSA